MIPTTRIMMQRWVSHTAPTLTVLVKKYTHCQGVVWSQYRLSGTFYVPLIFGVVLFAKVCFFLPMQFWKAVDFTLALLYLNFKLQYLRNYSSDFNNFCRFKIARYTKNYALEGDPKLIHYICVIPILLCCYHTFHLGLKFEFKHSL